MDNPRSLICSSKEVLKNSLHTRKSNSVTWVTLSDSEMNRNDMENEKTVNAGKKFCVAA